MLYFVYAWTSPLGGWQPPPSWMSAPEACQYILGVPGIAYFAVFRSDLQFLQSRPLSATEAASAVCFEPAPTLATSRLQAPAAAGTSAAALLALLFFL